MPERTTMQSIPLPRAPRILVVEDDEVLSMLLRYNLEAASYAVELAGDGISALRLLAERSCDLVVLDWNIPGLSGIEVLRQLRCVRHTRIPVLMLTARADSGDRNRAMMLGADAFIAKPFAIADLMAGVDRLIRGERGCVVAPPARHRSFTSRN